MNFHAQINKYIFAFVTFHLRSLPLNTVLRQWLVTCAYIIHKRNSSMSRLLEIHCQKYTLICRNGPLRYKKVVRFYE